MIAEVTRQQADEKLSKNSRLLKPFHQQAAEGSA
jgi:hypothetical protein